MLISMATSALATDITINGGANGSEYAAYKLLDATDGGNGKFAYTLNDKYDDILATVTGKTEQADIVAYINALDAADIQTFANAVYAAIIAADPAISADATTNTAKFEGVAQGYYLIAETKVGDTADTFSLVMLDTAGQESITVNTKEDKPSVEKKIEETNDTTGVTSWGDHADYDIGDSINYRITGTVSSKYADYNSYYYSFVDTMDTGLTYNQDAKVYVVNGEEKVDVTAQFTVANTVADEAIVGFTATANLKELTGVTVDKDSIVVVEYTATLNENAIHGKPGNENEVYLEYENNPYHEADGNPATPDRPGDETPENPDDDTPGVTPKDVNIVFTFKTVVNKEDKDGNALAGAGFTLYKLVMGEAEGEEPATADWVVVEPEITGVTTFNFVGLDAGKYKLVETTVPDGYNKCDDVVFEVAASYSTEVDPPALTALQVKDDAGVVISEGETVSFNVDLDEGVVSTDVVNLSGTELPSTGGMGTTILYVVGAILVLGGVVALIAKKRMSGSDN